MTQYDAVDLFAGPGGWDIAARELGISTIGIEFEKWACATRRAAGLATIEGDVTAYGPADFPGAKGLIASPPCQTFSMAGKGAGRKALDTVLLAIESMALYGSSYTDTFEDVRTGLVLEPLRWAMEARENGTPFEWLAFEQVPTVLPVWEAMAEVLRTFGYSVATGNVQAEQYGVPQTRKRAILVAHMTSPAALPVPTHSKYHNRDPKRLDANVLPWVSMAEALGWTDVAAVRSNYGSGGGAATGGAEPFGNASRQGMLKEVEAGRYYVSSTMPNATVRHESEPAPTVAFGHDYNSVQWVLRNNSSANAAERKLDQPAPTLYFGKRANFCEWQPRPVEDRPDDTARPYLRPSTTIVGSFAPDIVAAPGYRTTVSRQNAEGSIKVSAQEAACLQSFPDGYPWQGAKGKTFQQIGNAIPPVLAAAVLRSVVQS